MDELDFLDDIFFGKGLGRVRKGSAGRTRIRSIKAITSRQSHAPRANESFVKITSFGTFGEPGAKSYTGKDGKVKQGKALVSTTGHAKYISRDFELDIETSRGDSLHSLKEVNDFMSTWQQGGGRKHSRDVMNLVVGSKEGADPQAVLRAAKAFASECFQGHDWVMVLHEPNTDPKAKEDPEASKHPHVHIDVSMVDSMGKRLDPKKADLQHWREVWAEEMTKENVLTIATPCRARGVLPVRKQIEYVPDPDRPGKKMRIDHGQVWKEIDKKFRDYQWEKAAKSYLKMAEQLENKGEKGWAADLRAYALGIEQKGKTTDEVIKKAVHLGLKKEDIAQELVAAKQVDEKSLNRNTNIDKGLGKYDKGIDLDR